MKHHADWDVGAVGGCRPQSPRGVVLRIVAAGYALFFAQSAAQQPHVVVVDAPRRFQRAIFNAQDVALVCKGVYQPRLIARLVKDNGAWL